MSNLLRFPLTVFLLSFVLMWIAAWLGGISRSLAETEREEFGVVRAGALTLLGLIIAFSFSMASSRYDQRKNLEQAEASAIGTEYFRADFLPAAQATRVRGLLVEYLNERLRFYATRNDHQLGQIDESLARLDGELWDTVEPPVASQPTQVAALIASGMNDVQNSRGNTQAAWLNRIPVAAWLLMMAMGLCCNALIGYGGSAGRPRTRLLWVMPLVVAICFSLIADIDSPRGGVVRVQPENLESLSRSLGAQ